MDKQIIFFTKDHFNLFKKLIGRNMIDTALQDYEDTVRNLNKLKIAGNNYGKKIDHKKYDELITSAKADLNEKVERGMKFRES